MKKILVAAMSALLLCAAVYAADEVKLDGVNCVVANSKAAKAGNSTDYKGGKVYFCCMNCPKAFAKDPAKFATKANAQLILTKQATQVKCPVSGQDFVDDQSTKVSGIEVKFCCDKCKGKVEKATGDDQADLVFGDKAFEKGYKVAEKK